LGPAAVATEKRENGRRLDIIGYVIDLDTQRVSIARKNYLNTLYGFLELDINAPITLKKAERLASWSSRYGLVCRVMRPFNAAMNSMIAHRKHRHALISISNEARIAIRMWRAMLYLTRFDECRFTRSLVSFVSDIPTYVAEFDASLTGIGFLLYQKVNDSEVCLGGGAVDIRHLNFQGDSANQNVSEYIGAMVSLLGLVVLGIKCQDVALRGDSVAALTWAHTERARGDRVTNASMIFVTMCLTFNMDVKLATHISGDCNYRCDRLSRLAEGDRSGEQVMAEIGLSGSRLIQLNEYIEIDRLIQLCDPRLIFEEEESFISFWREAKELLNSIPESRM
jgi:hypothetical protein